MCVHRIHAVFKSIQKTGASGLSVIVWGVFTLQNWEPAVNTGDETDNQFLLVRR